MQILLCIDDTDILGSKGTGDLAVAIEKEIISNGWGKTYGVTRHQLLIHEDIPYTSHNSSMCFKADIDGRYLQTIIDYSIDFLEGESADGSDPGLCVVVVDDLKKQEALIEFGLKAKKIVLTKEDAYDFAVSHKIHLSEHGGTGQGIIGALAGTGLRLSGNDGRFKGKHSISVKDDTINVKELCGYPKIDEVRSLDGRILDGEELVLIGDKVKTVLLDNRSILLVYLSDTDEKDTCWKTCTKQQLRVY